MSIIYGDINSKNLFDEDQEFYVEVFCQQRNHYGEHICGDVFRSKRIRSEDRMIIVLSDGMGHGVKANVLATFTASFAVNFTEEHKDFEKIADIIMNTLPVCSERKISYSTFTIIDIDMYGDVKVLEYDNPGAIILRYTQQMEINWSKLVMSTENNKGKILRTTTFSPHKGDRIVFCSDGVAQSGLGSGDFPFGWGIDKCEDYVLRLIKSDPHVSASELAFKVVNQAYKNDNYHAKDDISCVAIYFRDPRKCILCSGPPRHSENDAIFADTAAKFKGKKIICGGTTSEIIARELKIDIRDTKDAKKDNDLPQYSEMEGFDLVTEGVLTLTKVFNILKQYNNLNFRLGKGPADKIVSILLDCDEVCFLIGTALNSANFDIDLPVELEIRRTVIIRIAKILEESFLKEVKIVFS